MSPRTIKRVENDENLTTHVFLLILGTLQDIPTEEVELG